MEGRRAAPPLFCAGSPEGERTEAAAAVRMATASGSPLRLTYTPRSMLQALEEFLLKWPIPTLLAGLLALIYGGHILVEAAIQIARRAGVSTLLIGLTIVAFGTSAPELAFNIIAAVDDNSDLSFGNIVGSNIANFGLVLGLSAAASPLLVHGRVVRLELPILIAISALMVAAALYLRDVTNPVMTGPGRNINPTVPGFSRPDGLIFLAGFAGFLWMMYRFGRQNRGEVLPPDLAEELAIARSKSLLGAILLFAAALALLLGGGKLAEVGAVGVATWLGLSQALIALTIIAVATSLPEIATSLIAARKGHADLAVGNVVGSNIFNILLVMGATALIAPVRIPRFGITDLIFMVLLTALVAALIFACRGRLPRATGIALLLLYSAYITWTVLREVAA